MSERGDLSAYLAIGMLFPLILLLAVGGASTVRLVGDRAAVVASAFAALQQAEIAGGLTPSISDQLAQEIRSEVGTAPSAVEGTPPPVPWGAQICLHVRVPASASLPYLSSVTVQLGGVFCGASDAPPN